MEPYTLMARMTVEVSRTIYAESFEDALARAKKMNVPDFVCPHKHADDVFDDYNDFEIYGICKRD